MAAPCARERSTREPRRGRSASAGPRPGIHRVTTTGRIRSPARQNAEPTMPPDPPYEQEETDLAAQEAAMIGGGGGEAEGFEEAEAALIEHASHGDQQSAHAILHDEGRPEENIRRDPEREY